MMPRKGKSDMTSILEKGFDWFDQIENAQGF
jgi:hypothetical protein